MSCHHCVMAVRKSLDSLEGINSSDVSVGEVRVVYDEMVTNRNAIEQAVRNIGYTIEG